jgi:hypothetical protein
MGHGVCELPADHRADGALTSFANTMIKFYFMVVVEMNLLCPFRCGKRMSVLDGGVFDRG